VTGTRRSLAERLYFDPLEQRLELARELAGRRGTDWRADPALLEPLQHLRDAAADLARASRGAGIDRICTDCGRRNEDGCCQPRMGDEASGAAYLVEILAFGEPPLPHPDDGSCPFMGDRGCVLELKPVICVNHLCPEIHAEVPGDEIRDLKKATGELLTAQVALEDEIVGRAVRDAG